LDKHLHIVAFDNPYPPIYGGVIDVFYKIVALSKNGIKIHLHIFTSPNSNIDELKKYCEEIYIYERKKGFLNQFSLLPYIVKSRYSSLLNKRLEENNFPILFEGMHTTHSLICNNKLFERSIIRHHNIEHDYYKGLYKSDKNIFRKIFFFIESLKLKSYLKKINRTEYNIAISEPDAIFLISNDFKNVCSIPPFHSSTDNDATCNDEPFVLYHGNLNVAENILAVEYLINEIFIDKTKKYIVAGLNNNHQFKNRFVSKSHIEFIENPSTEKIKFLIKTARVIVLPTFQPTGIKLKLIDSLYKGNHVIANQQMVQGFPIPEIVESANTSEGIIHLINEKIKNSLSIEEKNIRTQQLNRFFDNDMNARKIIEIISQLSR
jgi:hypothetical protein